MCLPFLNCITNKNKDSNRVSLLLRGTKVQIILIHTQEIYK
ncbi:hypothetical protein PARMER_01870 [Parabacteroides merdae ATCC 43184]|nr:hypothetical protein PARMER_01870 [Parabacteroides merdae ATCC 43184]